jgi:hypothetical protein
MSVAACIGLSQTLLTLIECAQSLQVMEVPPAIFPVRIYMSQGYNSMADSAEGIGTATTDIGCCVSRHRREASSLSPPWMLKGIATALPKNDTRVRIIIPAAGAHHQHYAVFGTML